MSHTEKEAPGTRVDLRRYTNVADLLDDGVENGSDLSAEASSAAVGFAEDDGVTEEEIEDEAFRKWRGLSPWKGFYRFRTNNELAHGKFTSTRTRRVHWGMCLLYLLFLWLPAAYVLFTMLSGAGGSGIVLLLLSLTLLTVACFRLPYLLLRGPKRSSSRDGAE